MNHTPRAPVRVRFETKLRLVQVARAELLTPRMRRITLAGEQLDGFTSAGAGDHVKLFFPAPGQIQPILPTLQDGKPTYPEGTIRPAMRDYTPRRYDPQTRELTIDFVLHGDGPATAWAAQAEPGQWLGIGGPRGSLLTPDDYDTYLLAGDETALPAISRHLEELRPGVRALVLLEVADAAEERHLPTAANATIIWLHRNNQAPGTTTLLEDALRALQLPEGDTYAWIGAELETARRLRRHLAEEEGFAREQIRAAGYWRLGLVGEYVVVDT